MKKLLKALSCLLALLAGFSAASQGTAFTYQGRLNTGGNPATGRYDLEFTLLNAAINGSQVGNAVTNAAVGVTNGLFTTTLDFGPVFNGPALWLQIGVETNGGGGEFTTLGALQPLTPEPYAIYATTASNATIAGVVANGGVTSASIAAGQVVRSLNGLTDSLTLAAGANVTLTTSGSTMTINSAGPAGAGTNAWSLTGNAGSSPASGNFLGTVDNQPLELHVNGARALRLEPGVSGAGAPNVVGGSSLNFVASGIVGATIGGGGAVNYKGHGGFINSVTGDFGTVAGGYTNTCGLGGSVGGGSYNDCAGPNGVTAGGDFNLAFGEGSTVSGGEANTANSMEATVGGGAENVAGGPGAVVGGGGYDGTDFAGNAASGPAATIAGGAGNTASSSYGTVSGGDGNTAAGVGAFVGGGGDNFCGAQYAMVGGGQLNSAINSFATVAGGENNTASGVGAFVGGGGFDGVYYGANTASGPASAVGGGLANNATAAYSTVSGGVSNVVNGVGSFVGGGQNNSGSGTFATVGGGLENIATGPGAFVGGGGWDSVEVFGNTASGPASTVVGGIDNGASAECASVGGGVQNQAAAFAATVAGGSENSCASDFATVGGGQENSVAAEWGVAAGGVGNIAGGNVASTVGGGFDNNSGGDYATVGGGTDNFANGPGAFVGGGGNDGIVFGGNSASGAAATVAGGLANSAEAGYATVPGGYHNSAIAEFSLAAGNQAEAANRGAFVWADSQNATFSSTANDQFCIRAQGGVQLNNSTSIAFGNATREMLQLYRDPTGTFNYGIGVQSSTFYMRTGTNGGFAWYEGGTFNGSQNNPGGGKTLMTLATSGLTVNGTFISSSDRNAKLNFAPVDCQTVLAKVAQLPEQTWSYKEDPATKHLGPMAQDFYAAFGTGADDKHIAVVDEGGVALAAIQGLNQIVEDKDAEICRQGAKIIEQETKICGQTAAIVNLQARLEKLEQLVMANEANREVSKN